MNDRTIETYNRGAAHYAEKFAGFGSRTADIERTLSFLETSGPVSAVELGCGAGRDAKAICERVDHYLGIDASRELLSLARRDQPGVEFVEADVRDFTLPQGTNVVFAFASVLHFDRSTNARIMASTRERLAEAGVCCISTKRGTYERRLVKDEMGEREFFYYELEDILDFSPGYEMLDHVDYVIGSTDWLTIILKKATV